jgi:hypothetical protein
MGEIVKTQETQIKCPDIREAIVNFETELRKMPGSLIGDSPEYLKICPLKHEFVDGAYVRELTMPKNLLFVSKIHKVKHPYFIMKGDVSVLTEDGIVRIKGPYHGITPAGTKRVIWTHEDTLWVTVHVTKETDLEKIEEEVIAKTYDDLDKGVIDVEIIEFVKEVSKEEYNV